MVTFGIKLDDMVSARRFLGETHKRISGVGAKWGLSGFAKQFGKGKEFFAVVGIRPFFGNTVYLAMVLTALMVIVYYSVGWTTYWVKIPIALLWLGSFVHTRVFSFLVMKLGLRKAGYAGQIKLYSSEDLIERLV